MSMSPDHTVTEQDQDAVLQQALQHCEREPIHQVGSVQPHGILLALDEHLVIRYCSGNAGVLFPVTYKELLGASFTEFISTSAVEQMHALQGLGDWRSSAVVKLEIRKGDGWVTRDAAISFNSPYWLVELEARASDQSELFSQMFVPTRDLLWQLDAEQDLENYTGRVVELVRLATGYDRVMMYQFDSNWDGEVIAESRSELTRSYLGNRFPASDIPAQARALYTRNLTRVIADVNAVSSAVHTEPGRESEPPLDLTYSAYRSLSPVHLEYLRNMGVTATLTISLIQNGKLWGMLACHHKSPKEVTLRERELYELIGKTISIKLSDLQRNEEKKLKDRVNRFLLDVSLSSLAELSAPTAEELMSIVEATGVVLVNQGCRYTYGQVPATGQLAELEAELRQRQPEQAFHADELARLYPEARHYADTACGILLAPLNQTLENYVMWCRGRMSYTRHWAGKPHKELSRTKDGFRISPRRSFDNWSQTYHNKSAPWTALQIELAADLAHAFIKQVSQQSMLAQEQAFRNLVELSATMIVRLDADGLIHYASSASEQILGRSADSLTGLAFAELLQGDSGDTFSRALAALYRAEHPEKLTLSFVHADGRSVWAEVGLRQPEGEGPGAEGAIVTVHDITQHHNYRMALEDLHQRNALLNGKISYLDARAIRVLGDQNAGRADQHLITSEAVLNQTSEAVVITGPDSRILSVNRSFCAITGYDADEAIGQKPSFLKSGIHTESFYQELWQDLLSKGDWEGEIWNRRKTGEIFPFRGSISAVQDDSGSVRNYVGVFSDNSKARQAEENLLLARNYDTLTGLPNRQYCLEKVYQGIASATRKGHGLAVVLLDIDSFKLLNDSQGHDVGDRFLKAVATRLADGQPKNGLLCRWGSDEFLLLVEPVTNKDDMALVMQQLFSHLSKPFVLPNHEVIPSACAGISFYPEDAEDTKGLIQAADTALLRAKECGPANIELFTPVLADRMHRKFEIANELRRAVREDELQLYFQPQVNSHIGTLIGVEALVRWNHPRKGLLGPAEFIPLAEELSQLELVGDWVLSKALAQMATWLTSDLNIPRVAVNIAPQQLVPGFADRVSELLSRYQVPASALELEITEGALERDDTIVGLLNQLRTMGIELSIDDFGTGYSSLAHLKHLPVNCFKLDKAFVDGLPEDRFDVAILRAVLALGHSLGIKVLAEGVETAAQYRFLAQQGVDGIQGYYFGRPMSAVALSDWINQRR